MIGYESDSPHGEGGIGGEETDYASTYGPGGTYEAFELREEQCAEAGLLNVEAEDAVSCGQSPVVKVYYREPIPVENDEYPSEGLEGYAYELCYLVFDERTGLDYESVPEDYESLVPSREAWEDGERDIICLLLEGEGEGSDSLDALGGVS